MFRYRGLSFVATIVDNILEGESLVKLFVVLFVWLIELIFIVLFRILRL